MTKFRTMSAAAALLAAAGAFETIPGTAIPTGLVGEGRAIIGMPFTPLSFAGVARRTAYRSVAYAGAADAAAATTAAVATTAAASEAAANQAAANAAAAQAAAAQAAASAPPPGGVPLGTVIYTLPPGCKSTPVNGIDYQYCNGSFWRPSFQGSQLVYVAANP